MIKNFFTKFIIFYHKYNLIFLGFVLFSVYFWSRFLRTRTSKDLPFDLSVLRFFILLYICVIFTYILISLIKTKKANPLIEKIIDWLFIPISEFDKYLKNISFIKTYYNAFLNYIIPKLDYLIIQTNLFYIIFWIIPRIILLSALFIDVFIFYQFHYKYQVILIGLLLFFNRYFKYSLKNTKNQLMMELQLVVRSITTDYYPYVHPAELEPDYDPNNPDEDDYDENPTMSLPLDIFIEHETESIVYRNVTNSMYISYKYNETKEKNILIAHNFPLEKQESSEASKIIMAYENKTYEPQILALLHLSVLLESYNKTSNHDQRIINIKILIYLNYLICWLFVLIISLPTLDFIELAYVFMRTWLMLQDPFCEEYIKEIIYNEIY